MISPNNTARPLLRSTGCHPMSSFFLEGVTAESTSGYSPSGSKGKPDVPIVAPLRAPANPKFF
jgi:hypothetical protein